MDEVRARKRRLLSAIVGGGGGVAAVSVALARFGLPGDRAGGLIFAYVFAGSVVLALLSYAARLFVKAPVRWRVNWIIVFRFVSRLSCMAAQLILLVLALLSYAARLFVKAPVRWRVNWIIVFRFVSRLSCMAAQLILLVLALLALPFDRSLARLLFHGLIVAFGIMAVWSMVSGAAINFALLSKRFRASIAPAE
jgi:hypothetical protein